MKKALLPLLLMLAVVGCSQTPEEQIAGLYDEAIAAMELQQLSTAQAAIDKIREIDAVAPEGLYLKGLLLEYKLQPLDAFEAYTWLMQRSPDYEHTYVRMFYLLTEMNAPLDAQYAAQQYSQKSSDNVMADLISAQSYNNSHQYQIADGIYSTRLKIADTDKDMFKVFSAYSLLKMGLVDSSEAYYAEGMRSTFTSAEPYHTAAEIMMTRGLYDSAAVLSTQATEVEGADFFDKVRHYRRLLDIGYFSRSREFLRNGFGSLDSLSKNVLDLDYAVAVDEKYLIRFNGDKYRILAKNNFSSIAYDMEARGKLSDIMSVQQDESMLLGKVVREEHPRLFKEFMMFYIARLVGEYDRSQESLKKIKKITDFRADDKTLISQGLYLRYQTYGFDDIRGDLQQLEQTETADPYSLRMVAQLYRRGDTRAMEKVYLKILRQHSFYPEAFEDLLEYYVSDDNLQKALMLFDNFPQYEKLDMAIFMRKAKVLLLAGEYASAIDIIEQSFKTIKGLKKEYAEFAKLLFKANQTELLGQYLTSLTSSAPENTDALVIAADYSMTQNQYDAALALLDKVIEMESDNLDFISRHAAALFYTSSKEKALEIFNSYLPLHDINPYLSINASRCMADDGTELDKAANLARAAVFNTYSSVESLTNLCYVYIKQGRFDLARGEGIKAVNVDDGYAPAHFWKGKAGYLDDKAKYRPEIIESLETALGLGMSDDLTADAQAMLKEL